MAVQPDSEDQQQERLLPSRPIRQADFLPFGSVVWPQSDGTPWQIGDAALSLDQGAPRLYLMTLSAPGLRFCELARHRQVSQCLGVMDPHAWYLVVGRPDHPIDQAFDPIHDLQAFQIPPRCLVVLHPGTWHAGPLFDAPAELVFCNLELRDTNLNDRSLLSLSGGSLGRVLPPATS